MPTYGFIIFQSVHSRVLILLLGNDSWPNTFAASPQLHVSTRLILLIFSPLALLIPTFTFPTLARCPSRCTRWRSLLRVALKPALHARGLGGTDGRPAAEPIKPERATAKKKKKVQRSEYRVEYGRTE